MKAHVIVEFAKPSYLPKFEMAFSFNNFENRPEDMVKDLLRCILKEDLIDQCTIKILNFDKKI